MKKCVMIETNRRGCCVSFAYRIETEAKAIVFSGDIRELEELVPAIGAGWDILLCEMGTWGKSGLRLCGNAGEKKLVFVHNSREILYGKPSVEEAMDACGIPAAVFTGSVHSGCAFFMWAYLISKH